MITIRQTTGEIYVIQLAGEYWRNYFTGSVLFFTALGTEPQARSIKVQKKNKRPIKKASSIKYILFTDVHF